MGQKFKNTWYKFWQTYRNISISSEDDLLYHVGKTNSTKVIDENQNNILVKGLIKKLQKQMDIWIFINN